MSRIKVLSHKEDNCAVLHLQGAWNEELINDLPNEDLYLILNHTYGYKPGELSFVAKIPRLKKLEIVVPKAIKELVLPSSLESISIAVGSETKVDFTNAPNLREAYIVWSREMESISHARELTQLKCWNLKASDLSAFKELTKLKRLGIYSSSISSLNGIEEFANLEFFGLAFNRKLSDVSALAAVSKLEEFEMQSCNQVTDISALGNCSRLRRVSLEKCKSISSYESISTLATLEFLNIVSCADISSLASFGNFPELRGVNIFGTNVVDGDLGCMLSNPKLFKFNFENKRHYSHRDVAWHKLKLGEQWYMAFQC